MARAPVFTCDQDNGWRSLARPTPGSGEAAVPPPEGEALEGWAHVGKRINCWRGDLTTRDSPALGHAASLLLLASTFTLHWKPFGNLLSKTN